MKLFGVNVANGYLSKISGACDGLNCFGRGSILLLLAGVSKSVNHSPEQPPKGKFAEG